MKKITLYIALLFIAANTFAQTEPANYKAVAAKFKLFLNNGQADSIYNMFGPQMTAALTRDNFKATTEQLTAQLGALNQAQYISFTDPVALYKATFQNAVLALNLSLNSKNQIIGLLLNAYTEPKSAATAPPPSAAIDASLTETPYNLETLAGKISGALTMPKNAGGKVPVVLIIAGSGATDRNGVANGYFQLAEALGKKGIATIRYDKRGVGQTPASAKEIDTRFTDFSNDAAGYINQIKEDQRFSKVIVLGHSEGSLIGMLAAYDIKINGFISLAGPGQSIDKTLMEQYKAQSPLAANALKPILDSLRKGVTVDKVDATIYNIARPSIQPYLQSWMRYDPAREIKRLKVPVLIIQGTTDIQVKVEDAQKLKKAKSDAELVLINGMNHVLKEAPADREQNKATYNQPNLPLKSELVTAITDFIAKIK